MSPSFIFFVRTPHRGNSASVIRIIPYAALHFMVYEQYRCWILNNCSLLGTGPFIDLLAGSAAGGTAVLCTYPLDLARTKLAYQVRFLDHGSLIFEWLYHLFITNIQIICHLYYLTRHIVASSTIKENFSV